MNPPLKFGYLVPTREAVMRAPGGRADIGRILELAVRAEQKGFDSVWVGDSILARPRFEALTMLAAIAARTQTVVAGEPERCADALRELAQAGARHFVVRFASNDQEAQMDRLLGEVVPLLSGA